MLFLHFVFILETVNSFLPTNTAYFVFGPVRELPDARVNVSLSQRRRCHED